MFNSNAQDRFAADYRVYLEGVQIPFESVHISNVYQQLPTASITLPPWQGLQELGRNYMPKIDIFWRDPNFGITEAEAKGLDEDELVNLQRDAYKVLFSGVITGTVDSKSISAEGGMQGMTLNCVHALTAMNDILIRYGNSAVQAAQELLASNADSTVTISEWDINTMMIKALMGVDSGKATTDAHYVESDKLGELQGTPGILRVMWNILKRDANTQRGLGKSEILTNIYIPLIEEGLQFWERMTGHPTIEIGIQDEDERVPYDNGDNKVNRGVSPDLKGNLMVPPVFRSFLGDAAQKELALASIQSIQAGGGSPESVSFMAIMENMLRRLEYDMITLSSPVSVGDDGSRSYEYIIKPVLPAYYSPICNAILPNLISDVTVNNNYDALPSRTANLSNLIALVANSGVSSNGGPDQTYISPHSVRYARAGGESGNLQKSLYSMLNVPGKYEYGSGVRAKTTQLPPLYNLMRVGLDKREAEGTVDATSTGSKIYSSSVSAWNKMYPGSSKYNPISKDSGISAFGRLNFMYADQQFATEVAKARTAQASGVFNPYPVVGYPMDLIDSTPSRESYHGLCTSISHTIHASGSSSTSYGVSAVNTFSELAKFNIPAVNPYLSGVFNFTEDSRIYANATAYTTACDVYLGVFGVGAAEPALMQDCTTGTINPFTRTDSSGCWTTADADDKLDSVQGSLDLVARNISSLYEMDTRREAAGLSKYIDIAYWSDTKEAELTNVTNATNVEMSTDRTKIIPEGKDTESSPFLDY